MNAHQIPTQPLPPIDVVVMAAGKGTRMKSAISKVLQRLAGKPLLQHVLDAALALGARQTVVVTGHQAEQVQALATQQPQTQIVRQEPQLGTGHAVLQAMPLLADDGITVVLSGDVPLIAPDTLQNMVDLLLQEGPTPRLVLLTIELEDPSGYGRIVRNDERETGNQNVLAIVEQKDASEQERQILEIYSGMMAAPTALLRDWLSRIDNRNAQQEYYLTDVVKLAVLDGVEVVALKIDDVLQVTGINSPVQLAALERAHQQRQAQKLMEQGVRLADPARLDVRGSLQCGQDVEIDINCIFEGTVVLGDQVQVGAHCVLKDVRIDNGARIQAFCHLEGATVGPDSIIGPYARLRPGSQLDAQVHIGNFVEIKNSHLAQGAKANHLAYVGDAHLGQRVNFGAGSITANYDGANKHRTTVGDDVHVGSNCVLVAPVEIGQGGTIGAGSTITKNTAPGALTVARGKQMSIANWQRPSKKK